MTGTTARTITESQEERKDIGKMEEVKERARGKEAPERPRRAELLTQGSAGVAASVGRRVTSGRSAPTTRSAWTSGPWARQIRA